MPAPDKSVNLKLSRPGRIEALSNSRVRFEDKQEENETKLLETIATPKDLTSRLQRSSLVIKKTPLFQNGNGVFAKESISFGYRIFAAEDPLFSWRVGTYLAHELEPEDSDIPTLEVRDALYWRKWQAKHGADSTKVTLEALGNAMFYALQLYKKLYGETLFKEQSLFVALETIGIDLQKFASNESQWKKQSHELRSYTTPELLLNALRSEGKGYLFREMMQTSQHMAATLFKPQTVEYLYLWLYQNSCPIPLNTGDSELARKREGARFGLFAISSVLNHDCDPNTFFKEGDNWRCPAMKLVARKTIQPDEELTTCYVPDGLEWFDRRDRLLKEWGFLCKCNRCKADMKMRPMGRPPPVPMHIARLYLSRGANAEPSRRIIQKRDSPASLVAQVRVEGDKDHDTKNKPNNNLAQVSSSSSETPLNT